jgi:hypothetical protein
MDKQATKRFITKSWVIYILLLMNVFVYLSSSLVQWHNLPGKMLFPIIFYTLTEIFNFIALFYFRPWKIMPTKNNSYLGKKSLIIYSLIIMNLLATVFYFPIDYRNFPYFSFEIAIICRMLKDLIESSNFIALFYFRPWTFKEKIGEHNGYV